MHAVILGGTTFDVLDHVEEILEMAGSSMFLLALYLVWRRLAVGRAPLSGHHAGA